ncbi:hypothetical protein [Erwinia psidii]|nr:hypothetical protein [Erwinia psidii]
MGISSPASVSHAVKANQQQNKEMSSGEITGIDLATRVFQVHITSVRGEKKINKMLTCEKLMAFIT